MKPFPTRHSIIHSHSRHHSTRREQETQDHYRTTIATMSKILTVFGATGQQGGSVVSYVLSDPTLSQTFRVRAVTRNPESAASVALKARGVEVVRGDLTDASSLPAVVAGSHTVFIMTLPDLSRPDTILAYERDAAKAGADASVAAGVEYLIFSTLPHVRELSGGKYTKVAGFDGKAEAEKYIRGLPIRSAFFAAGSFMQNFSSVIKPRPVGGDTYALSLHVNPTCQFPLIDVRETGKWVTAILLDPAGFEGKVLCGAARLYTMEEMAGVISRKTGKNVIYQQCSPDDFRAAMHHNPYAELLIEMMLWQQEFGYFGPGTEEQIKWSVEHANGKITTFEEFLDKEPVLLD